MHFGVQEHLTTVRRHWGKIALVMLVAVMVTGAVGFLSSKVYISQARILLLNCVGCDWEVTGRGRARKEEFAIVACVDAIGPFIATTAKIGAVKQNPCWRELCRHDVRLPLGLTLQRILGDRHVVPISRCHQVSVSIPVDGEIVGAVTVFIFGSTKVRTIQQL